MAFILKTVLEMLLYYLHPERLKTLPDFFVQVLLYLTLTQIWIPKDSFYYAIVPACWYLSMTMVLYFLQPLLLSFAKKLSEKGKIAVSFLCMIFLGILTLCLKDTEYGAYIMYFFPLTRAIDFFIAINVGVIVKKQALCDTRRKKIDWTVIELISLISLIASLFSRVETIWQQNIFFMPIALIVVSVFSQDAGMISMLARSKWILSFANITYIIFIIHHVIYSYMEFINKYILHFSAWKISITTLIITVITSYCLQSLRNLWERRFIKNDRN